MEKITLHKANTRGHANQGWLDAYHTFSFSDYSDPSRVHFGALRVLNDDTIAAGNGFGKHPHNNMEIITIPLEGGVAHKDSMGHEEVISAGEVQVMSAGTGIYHSEYNASKEQALKLLQIWLFPKEENVTPRYGQATFNKADRTNKLQQILSPGPTDTGLWIHQDAWFHLGALEKGFGTDYLVRKPGNGVYAFVISGDVTINGTSLNKRDGVGIEGNDVLHIQADSDAELLLMDVPMI